MTSPTPPMARRGDLVVVHVKGPSGTLDVRYADDFYVGLVTSVTRDGQVKALRPAGTEGTWLIKHIAWKLLGSWVMSVADIDVDAALSTAAAHRYPASEMTMPYGSLDEVRDALRPHLKEASTS